MSLVDSASILLWIPTLCGKKASLQRLTDVQSGLLGVPPEEAEVVLVSEEQFDSVGAQE